MFWGLEETTIIRFSDPKISFNLLHKCTDAENFKCTNNSGLNEKSIERGSIESRDCCLNHSTGNVGLSNTQHSGKG